MTGFRNALAHDYEELDPEKLYGVLHHHLGDIATFISVIEEKIKNGEAGN